MCKYSLVIVFIGLSRAVSEIFSIKCVTEICWLEVTPFHWKEHDSIDRIREGRVPIGIPPYLVSFPK